MRILPLKLWQRRTTTSTRYGVTAGRDCAAAMSWIASRWNGVAAGRGVVSDRRRTGARDWLSSQPVPVVPRLRHHRRRSVLLVPPGALDLLHRADYAGAV